MISLTKTKSGKVIASGTGKITSAPQYRTFDSGNTLTSFFINSDSNGKGKDKQFESYKINAWGEWSDYANALEKGDVIYVEGECVKDDYNSKRNKTDEYMINVQELFIANIGIEVMHLRFLVDDLRKGLESYPNATKGSASGGVKPNEQIDPESEYGNINLNDFPFGAGDDDYQTNI